MRRFNAKVLVFNTAVTGTIFVGVGGLMTLKLGLGWWTVACAVLWLAVLTFLMRRYIKRALNPIPPAHINLILSEMAGFYPALTQSEQGKICQDVHWFLIEQKIIGVGVEVDDTLRVLTAASAVLLTLGIEDYEWDNTRDILIYPSAFTEDYEHSRSRGKRLGQVGAQGPIILSAEALRVGFAKGSDGHNVGIHEFAHVLDFDDGYFDGLPTNLNWQTLRPWLDVMSRHLKSNLLRHKSNPLRQYAYTNEAEFFACATEVYFEQPKLLNAQAPELYALLKSFYRQDTLSRAHSLKEKNRARRKKQQRERR